MGLDEILKLICEIEIKRKRVNVGLFDALGYVFASDIYALRDLPSFDNSALDGYAFAYDDKKKDKKEEGFFSKLKGFITKNVNCCRE